MTTASSSLHSSAPTSERRRFRSPTHAIAARSCASCATLTDTEAWLDMDCRHLSLPGSAHSYSSTLRIHLVSPNSCWFDHTHPSQRVPVLRHVWLETRDPVHVAHACVLGIMTQLCLVWAEQDMTSSLLVTEVHPSRRIITETEIQP